MELKKKVRFERADPILSVSSLSRSLKYYTEVLGFGLDWGSDDFACVTDSASIHLSEGDQGGPGTWVWVGVEDVEPLYEEYLKAAATIGHPPENYPWAYDMKIVDPDGHVLRIGSDPRADLPFK